LHPVPPDGRAGASSEFRESIVAGFLPGERRNTIDLSVPLLIGKRLFLQNVRLMAVLPKGQSVLVSIGSPLRFNGNGYAPLGLYTDQKTALKAQVTRDSLEGSGQFTLIVEGNYVDVPQHR
jgi:hypothetical protein